MTWSSGVSDDEGSRGESYEVGPILVSRSVLDLSPIRRSLPVSGITGATCVSALSRLKSLKVLFHWEHDAVVRFRIGGPVRKI